MIIFHKRSSAPFTWTQNILIVQLFWTTTQLSPEQCKQKLMESLLADIGLEKATVVVVASFKEK